MTDDALPPIGVILSQRRGDAAAAMDQAVSRLIADGVDVGGLIQRELTGPDGACGMALVDARLGVVYPISQTLGPGSVACKLDSGGLAESSQVLRREIARPATLLVVNKFALQEAEGRGLAAEMLAAVSAGVALLTSVTPEHRPAWEKMMGGAGEVLAPTAEAILAWWARQGRPNTQ